VRGRCSGALEVVPGEIRLEPLGIFAARGSRFWPRASAPAGAPPSPHPDYQRHGRREERRNRDQIGGEVEARSLRGGEDLLSVLRYQRVLDLLLALALGYQPTDEDPLAHRLRRFGELQQGSADRAHHLVLDVGE
jgi:hypothetical protein